MDLGTLPKFCSQFRYSEFLLPAKAEYEHVEAPIFATQLYKCHTLRTKMFKFFLKFLIKSMRFSNFRRKTLSRRLGLSLALG